MTTAAKLLLACNAGSSSLKLEVFAAADWRSQWRAEVREIGRAGSTLDDGEREVAVAARSHADAAELLLERLESAALGAGRSAGDLVAVGHRVVHGGEEFAAPTLLGTEELKRLRSLGDLAPLHNPPALAVIDAVAARWPGLPAVAVFDTAFYRALPPAAQTYAVPREWVSRHGIRRYGFHGLAHEYLARRLAELSTSTSAPRRALSLQLGHGCSITALADGAPVETSMGFTPLEGLVMGTRCGDIDAGALVHLARRGWSAEQLDDALNRRSGLLGLSGASDDMRELLKLEKGGHAGAALALDVFCHRLLKYIGAYAAVLGGVDAIAFGGGIGENSPVIRARVCAGLQWLGLAISPAANEQCVGREGRISTPESTVEAYVIPVREAAAIARATLELIEREGRGELATGAARAGQEGRGA
jgi:acetate kinase